VRLDAFLRNYSTVKEMHVEHKIQSQLPFCFATTDRSERCNSIFKRKLLFPCLQKTSSFRGNKSFICNPVFSSGGTAGFDCRLDDLARVPCSLRKGCRRCVHDKERSPHPERNKGGAARWRGELAHILLCCTVAAAARQQSSAASIPVIHQYKHTQRTRPLCEDEDVP
jgi:hypothetical protein